MLEFKKRVLEMNIYGEEISIPFPTVAEYKAFDKEMKKKNNKKTDFEMMSDFLVSLGMKLETIESLEPGNLLTIIETLTGSKEKK